MVKWCTVAGLRLGFLLALGAIVSAQEPGGSIRGIVFDDDFDLPLAEVRVLISETRQETTTSAQGHYVFEGVTPGTYTLFFTKEGYERQTKGDVVVFEGQLTDLDVRMPGEFVELDEFVVQDLLRLGGGSEAALLQLRFESPSLVDSIGEDLMSRAGAGDAASALRLVPGASVKDGKSAVIRGLPDRYVSSQVNGVRVPSADEDKRAVELDQFPSAVIESIQVSKTFMPDQQGDASGGAVNVRLKSIPEESIFKFKTQVSYNTNVAGRSNFLTYDGGGVTMLGMDDGGRDIQGENLGQNWDGAVGTSTTEAPIDYKWSGSYGGKTVLDNGIVVGGFASVFYERDSSYYDDGIDDNYWVEHPGGALTPRTLQGGSTHGDFKTALFDVTQGTQSVQWGGVGTVGMEAENHRFSLTYLLSHTAEDKATVAEDTRGKEYFFPGYDPNDPTGPGNEPDDRFAAPYIRTETLEYTERSTGTLQLHGRHTLPIEDFDVGSQFRFRPPQLDWTASTSYADMYQPDKRLFGALWLPPSYNPGVPPWVDPFTTDPTWLPFKPAANINMGNLQRIWKEIEEDSTQLSVNLNLPFDQGDGEEGNVKLGFFADRLDRSFDQDSFSNFGDSGISYGGGWGDYWSDVFADEDHPISASEADVDYDGELDLTAWYAMVDLPLTETLRVMGGARFESTEIGVVNHPESEATWFPPGATAPVALNEGDGDVQFGQHDVLPALGVVWEATDKLTVRGAYSRTVARQTFKELTPIIQQEYLGSPIFIGNPELEMSSLDNYDLRLDFTPCEGGLISLSWFHKNLEDPIEYVQRLAGFTFTTAKNYPKGELTRYEIEVRQKLETFWPEARGMSMGANATFIDSDVRLPDEDIAGFSDPSIDAPMTHRDMTNAPEHLYNLYWIYDREETGTEIGLFYTLEGDMLVAGAGYASGNFVPSVYATERDTLNLSIRQKIGKYFHVQFQGKNLTNSEIETVYRSEYIGDDVIKTSHTQGIDYSISFGFSF